MTVKEVFELRKQGKIEEAYEAIRPMYAVHKGKYTTSCMFWTACDIQKKRMKESQYDEAEKIFKALLRILPNIEDDNGIAHRKMYQMAATLSHKIKSFNVLDYIASMQVERMREEDWEQIPAIDPYDKYYPSIGHELLSNAFIRIKEDPTVDNALKVMPLLEVGMNFLPFDEEVEKYKAMIELIIEQAKKDDESTTDQQQNNN